MTEILEEKHENLNQIRGIKTTLSSAVFIHGLVPFERYGQPKETFLYFKEKINEIICKTSETKISLRAK